MVLAKEEAKENNNTAVGIPHLVMGLLREEHGLAALILGDCGVTRADVSYEGLPCFAQEATEDEQDNPPFGTAAKKALDFALREALSLGHNYIGTEHILLGVIRVQEDVPGSIELPIGLRDDIFNKIYGRKTKPETNKRRREQDKLEDALTDVVSKGEALFKSVRTAVELFRAFV